MSIFKVNTSWIQSVRDNLIGESFGDAWANIINATRGAWGDITIKVTPNKELTFQVIKGRFFALWDTTLEGAGIELTIPFEPQDVATIKIQYVNGAIVSSEKTYILNNGTTIQVDLDSGRKLITFDGFARRI